MLSEACYRFVEMPIRRGALSELWARRRPSAVLAGGLAASTVAVLGIALAQVGPYDVAAGGEVEQFVLAIPGQGSETPPTTATGLRRRDRRRPPTWSSRRLDSGPGRRRRPRRSQPPTSTTTSTSTTTTTTTLPVLPRSVAIVGDSQAHSLFVNLPRGIDDYFEFSDGAVSGCSVHESGEIVTARRGFHNDFGICHGWAAVGPTLPAAPMSHSSCSARGTCSTSATVTT